MTLNDIHNIYLIGDTHFGIRNNSVEWSEIQHGFFEFFFKKIEPFFNPDHDIIIFQGDIFHYREAVNVRVQNEVLDLFTKLSEKFKRGVFAITGNHDTYYKDKSEIHSLRVIGDLANNIHIFENPEILSINGQHNFLLVPWIEDSKRMKSVLSDHFKFAQYVICHTDVVGFKFNKWASVEKGLDLDSMKEYKRIYSGHIHIRQQKGNMLYTGTPYQMDRGDVGNTKGFYILNVASSEIEEKFVRNTHSPVFLKFKLYDVLEMSIPEINHAFNNNFVDIMIDVSFANTFTVTRFLEAISESKHRKLEFFTYTSKDKEQVKTADDFNSEDDFSLTDIFKAYLKTKEYSADLKRSIVEKFVDINKVVKEEKDYA